MAFHRCLSLLFIAWQLPVSGTFAQTPVRWLEALDLRDAPPLATIDCIFEDSRGFIWFGTYSGLYKFDGYTMTPFKHDPNDVRSISDNKIKKLLEDRQGNFWVGTQVGLNFYDSRKKIFRRYIDKQKYGIGDIEIYDLKLDKTGAIWVATADGLYKMASNDAAFEKKFPMPSDKVAISPVYALEISNPGLYFYTEEGLFYRDFVTEKVVAIPAEASFQARTKKWTVCLQKDYLGTIWIGVNSGLFYYDPSVAQKITLHPAFKNKPVNFIACKNDKGELWIGAANGLTVLNTQTRQCETDVPLQVIGEKDSVGVLINGFQSSGALVWLSSSTRQLYKMDPRKQRFQHVPISLVKELKDVSRLFELYEYNPGELLIPQKYGAALLNLYTQKPTPFSKQPSYNLAGWKAGVICFLEEKDGHLWIGTGGGLFLFDKKKRQFVQLEKADPEFSKLRGVIIRKIHRDPENNLWVATWKDGIFKINPTTHTIRQYNISVLDQAHNISNTRSIAGARDGSVWVGARGGLLHYRADLDSFVVYKNNTNDPESMSENTAFCIYEDTSGAIWCGTYGGGLNKLDIKTGKFKHYTTRDGLLNNNVFSLLPDKKGNLWLLGYDGISVYNPVTDSFRVFTHDQGLINEEYDGFLYGKSRFSNHLFFCGKTGIDYFDPDSVQLSQYAPKIWITDFKLFNKSVPITVDRTPADPFSLPADISYPQHLELRYEQNVITFDYVALDFSSPRTIRYAYQLVGFDKGWQVVGDKRSVTFTNLNPGNYTFQVKATNGDGVWGSEIATVTFTILTPWWRTWWFIVLVFFVIAGLITMFYRYRIQQIREKDAIRASLNQRITAIKMEALRSQMNPHFIYNCLNSIKLYVEKNETEKASSQISKFAKLLRQVLDQSQSDVITLEKELDTLRQYIELEKMRYKNFDFQIDLQPDMPIQDILLPPLLLQPYVENSIWHGLQPKKNGACLLLVKIGLHLDECQITVEDNVIGRAAAVAMKQHNNAMFQSYGLNVTSERTALFAQKYQNNARIEIVDLADPEGIATGTRVQLTFKVDPVNLF